ncbi:MAG TPA: hypothetical protein VFI03_05570 [Solirubrobacterales bacterium]|nr:hypothetical protein [Solirubrobacterales bacterium]
MTVGEPLPPRPPDLSRLLEPLIRHGVDFVLIGGMAGLAQGSNYPSYDLDIVYSRGQDNIARMVAALKELDVRVRGAPPELEFVLDERTIENGTNFTFVTPFGDLDVLGDVAGLKGFDELAAAAEEKQIAGFSILVASIDHLIAMKRAANRPKDRNMLEEYLVIAERRQQKAGGDGAG